LSIISTSEDDSMFGGVLKAESAERDELGRWMEKEDP
jgi:hypothetical protein